MTTETVANGITITDSATQPTYTPRRLAAAFDRGHPAIHKISANVPYDAVVWLADDAEEGASALEIPDGWEVHSMFVTSNGGHAIRINRVQE